MEAFHEDPFVYPVMSCPLCGIRFRFKEPFQECDTLTCPKCGRDVDIPDDIIGQFLDNIEFKQYIEQRTPPGGPINSQPPIT